MDLSTLQHKSWDLHLAQLCGEDLLPLLAAVVLTVELDHDGAQGWEVTGEGNVQSCNKRFHPGGERQFKKVNFSSKEMK